MRTVVLAVFWLFLIGSFLRLLCLTVLVYPRSTPISRGQEATAIVLNLAVAAWCATVLWS